MKCNFVIEIGHTFIPMFIKQREKLKIFIINISGFEQPAYVIGKVGPPSLYSHCFQYLKKKRKIKKERRVRP